jgi:hypothetical protein
MSRKKREELGIKYKRLYWLMRRRSAMSTHNKLVLYKQILKPVWTNAIQLSGCTKPNNIAIILRSQNKAHRNIVDAPWYVRNAALHMEMVTTETGRSARRHEGRLLRHDVASDLVARQ